MPVLQDRETLEAELYAARATPAEIEAGARRLLAEARGTSSPRLAGRPG
ncbi:hypothetical protein [Frankia sp. R43]|nr:hypothetical protein [Frankia sp. R43]